MTFYDFFDDRHKRRALLSILFCRIRKYVLDEQVERLAVRSRGLIRFEAIEAIPGVAYQPPLCGAINVLKEIFVAASIQDSGVAEFLRSFELFSG